MRPVRLACGHATELLLILKKNIFDLIIRGEDLDMTVQRMSHDFVRGQSVVKPVSATGASVHHGQYKTGQFDHHK